MATVNSSKSAPPSLNLISEGTRIKGTVQSENDIRISGKIEGEIKCKGKTIVASSAVVDGEIVSTEADIAGTVTGIIKVSEKITLRESSVVESDIYAKVLAVEEGAKLNGNCKIGIEIEKINLLKEEMVEKPVQKKAASE